MPKLGLPAGIKDASLQAVLDVLNERFDAIPVERVLVWHLDSVVADALPHLGDQLGITGPEFGSAPPRTFLSNGIQKRRRRGTGGTMRAVLSAIGYDPIVIEETTDKRFLYDGTWKYDATIHCGGDSHWAIFIVRIDVAAMPSVEQIQLLWDVIQKWRPRARQSILVLNKTPENEESWFRSREEIVSPPTLLSATPNTGAEGLSVALGGSGFIGVHTVRFGGVDAAFIVDADDTITATAPAHADGAVDVEVIRSNGRAKLAGGFTYDGAVAPVLTAADNAQGDPIGGGSIVLTGSGFNGATAVKFGTTNAAFTIDSNTQITATLPANLSGVMPEFDGVDDHLEGPTTPTLLSNSAAVGWSIKLLVYLQNIDSTQYLFDDENDNVGAYMDVGGVLYLHQYLSDGLTNKSVNVSGGHPGWNVCDFRWTGTALEARLNYGPWASTPAASAPNWAAALRLGTIYNGSFPMKGHIAQFIAIKASFLDADFDNLTKYFNARYGTNFNELTGAYVDPSTLALTAWVQDGNYSAATGTWTGSASAGTSGSNNFTQATALLQPTAKQDGIGGSANITVTGPYGTSGPLAFAYWNPILEDGCTGLIEQPDYAAVAGVNTWIARVGKNATSTGSNLMPPDDGTGEPNFDGTAGLDCNADITKLLSDTEGTAAVVFNPSNADASYDANAPYNRGAVFSKNGSGPFAMSVVDNLGAGGTKRGFMAYIYDTTTATYPEALASLGSSPVGTTRAIVATFKGGVETAVSVDGSSFSAASVFLDSCSTVAYSGNLRLGMDYAAGMQQHGTMRAFATFKFHKTDAFATKFHKWAQQRFGAQ